MELEQRYWEIDSFEIRGTGEDRTVRGLGVPFGKLSEDLGGFKEKIRSGATTESLRRNDVALLWQHDAKLPISRQSATRNALVLEERSNGVFFEQNAASFTEFQLDKINDGVVRQMSFGFRMLSEIWDESKKMVVRELLEIDLRELSPVTFPAYPSTKLALRCAADAGVVFGEDAERAAAKALLEHQQREVDVAVAQLGL